MNSSLLLSLLLFVGVGVMEAKESLDCTLDMNGDCTDDEPAVDSDASCMNHHDSCLTWAVSGECGKNAFMTQKCRQACRYCSSCYDAEARCPTWADLGECKANPRYMLFHCPKSCQVCELTGHEEFHEEIEKRMKEKKEAQQTAMDNELKTRYGVEQTLTTAKAKENYENMTHYMENIVYKEDRFASVREECKNRNANCAFWAATDECVSNITRAFMVVQCAPSCNTCEHLDFDTRCPYDADEPTALQPGDLNKLFEKIIGMDEYKPTVLSRPSPDKESDDGPWVVQLDTFLSPEECETLIQLGADQGYATSADVGKQKFDGTYDTKVYDGRTSSNAWCQNDCIEHETTKAVTARIETLTGVPEPNHEFLQMLRYHEGQFYKIHHDYIVFHQQRKQGVRTLTVFLYLNDVEEGGGTDFPKLGLTVEPKQGRALIWPSVKNEDPNEKDHRTDHQALAVVKGIKYGANAWIHQRDFKEPHARACI